MNNQLIKTIVFGALLGAALFAAPFFALKVIFFILIFGFIFRVVKGRRHWHSYSPAYFDKIRSMDEAEYEEFKKRFPQGKWTKNPDED